VVVAYDNYASQENPLNIEDMFNLTNSYYVNKDEQYQHLRDYHRTIKFEIYNKYISEDSYIIDIGAGKGQDIHRYDRKKVKMFVAIDPVFDSLHELQRRMLTRKHWNSKPRLITVCANAEEFDKIYSTIYSVVRPDARFRHIIISFSIHYIHSVSDTLEKYVSILQSGGTIIILYIDTSDTELIADLNKHPKY
jgi:ubiquinone/menaquinone biosynthesis C-methylase UbiE